MPVLGGFVRQHLSWFTPIIFCAATAFLAALALAILFTSATVAFAGSAMFAPADSSNSKEFSGVISDSHCMGRHVMKDKSPEECTRLCVARGSKYTLVDGENAYTLEGDSTALTARAGERVTVSGVLEGGTIKVTAVKSTQSQPPGE
jgi:predicted lipoprotein with Yx(FWY)xxD motif